MADAPFIVDEHVHITNRVYWEGLDPWQPRPIGFDDARAKASGVNRLQRLLARLGPLLAGDVHDSALICVDYAQADLTVSYQNPVSEAA